MLKQLLDLMIVLQLENELLKFERRLPVSKEPKETEG